MILMRKFLRRKRFDTRKRKIRVGVSRVNSRNIERLRDVIFTAFESILIAFVGRPVLLLIKWFRWPLLFYGFYFNAISTYDPSTKLTTSHFTLMPFVIGLVLFSLGTAIKRYDELHKDYMELCDRISESPLAQHLLDG